ncbi:MAG: YggU family protein [Desulfobulbaceae bacterium]|nr:YggU family protein [Desulfobulbaceae bacterium]
MPCLSTQADGSVLLRIHVQPRAAQNQVAGLQGEALKLRLSAPPVDGKANKAVLAFLAELFSLPKSALSLKSGQQSRQKTILISGASEATIRKILATYMQK